MSHLLLEGWAQEYEEIFEKTNGYSCEVVRVEEDGYWVHAQQKDFSKWTKEELVLATAILWSRIYEE